MVKHILSLSFWAALVSATSVCNNATLNTTVGTYPITVAGTTVQDVANATNRGVCDIGRANLMADVSIVPNVGQSLIIPPETCTPDNESCILMNANTTRTCINGGPRLYFTVNGDTYQKIALRLNITVAAVMGNSTATTLTGASDELEAGQFVKIPLCEPSDCGMM